MSFDDKMYALDIGEVMTVNTILSIRRVPGAMPATMVSCAFIPYVPRGT
jgi:hypothetical protein